MVALGDLEPKAFGGAAVLLGFALCWLATVAPQRPDNYCFSRLR